MQPFFKDNPLRVLLYNQLTTSFLIGRKSTVNFGNQRLGCHLAADYTIIMSRALNVTGDQVMYYRGAWFLRIIMSSLCALCCLPSVKKQKHDFQVCFIDQARRQKNSWRQGLTNKKVHEGSKGTVCWLREREKTESWHKLWKHFMSKQERKPFAQSIIKQL